MPEGPGCRNTWLEDLPQGWHLCCSVLLQLSVVVGQLQDTALQCMQCPNQLAHVGCIWEERQHEVRGEGRCMHRSKEPKGTDPVAQAGGHGW